MFMLAVIFYQIFKRKHGCLTQSFKRQFYKMVSTLKQFVGNFADKLFECVWPFCGIGAYRVNNFQLEIVLVMANPFMHNYQEWPNMLKGLEVWSLEDVKVCLARFMHNWIRSITTAGKETELACQNLFPIENSLRLIMVSTFNINITVKHLRIRLIDSKDFRSPWSLKKLLYSNTCYFN